MCFQSKTKEKIQNHSRVSLSFVFNTLKTDSCILYTEDKKMTTEEKTKEEDVIVPTKTAGAILFCGCTDFKNVGRTKQIDESVFANVNVPSKISTFENENDLEFTFIASGSAAAHNVAIDTKGRLWAWGRNENGQLGTGDKDNRNAPSVVKGIHFGENADGEGEEAVKIVWAACGKNHTIAIVLEKFILALF